MESAIKLEKLDDEEFQSISIEDTQLSEVVLPHDPCLVSPNGVKSMVSGMEGDETSSASETDHRTLTVKPSSANDTASSAHKLPTKSNRIYSPPFYKIVSYTGK